MRRRYAEAMRAGGFTLGGEQSGHVVFADYLELTKPRIAVMALFTVAVGYVLAAGAFTCLERRSR